MEKQCLLVILLLVWQVSISQNNKQKELTVIKEHFNNLKKKSKMASLDYAEWKITSTAPSLKKGLTHYYLTQYYKGIPIVNGTYNMSIVDNKVNYSINQFITNLTFKAAKTKSNTITTEEQAVLTVVNAHNLPTAKLVRSKERIRGESVTNYKNTGVTEDNEPILVKKVYFFTKKNYAYVGM